LIRRELLSSSGRFSNSKRQGRERISSQKHLCGHRIGTEARTRHAESRRQAGSSGSVSHEAGTISPDPCLKRTDRRQERPDLRQPESRAPQLLRDFCHERLSFFETSVTNDHERVRTNQACTRRQPRRRQDQPHRRQERSDRRPDSPRWVNRPPRSRQRRSTSVRAHYGGVRRRPGPRQPPPDRRKHSLDPREPHHTTVSALADLRQPPPPSRTPLLDPCQPPPHYLKDHPRARPVP
jgi:hypothetical protein